MSTNYCTPAEIRAQTNTTGTTGSKADNALNILIAGVSRAIDKHCKRPDGFLAAAVASARLYPGSGGAYQWIDECISVSLVEVKDSPTSATYTAWAATDYYPFSGDPKSPDFSSLPYHGLLIAAGGDYSSFTAGGWRSPWKPHPDDKIVVSNGPTVKVTARWGYAAAVPDNIKAAVIAMSTRFMKQGESSWADGLASTDFGQLLYNRENRDILAMLEDMIWKRVG